MITISMERAGGGMAIALDGGSIVNPTTPLSVPSIVNRLIRIPAIAAATIELDGLEGLIGQLYIIFVGKSIERRYGAAEKPGEILREGISRAGVPALPVLRTGASHRASGKRRSTRR